MTGAALTLPPPFRLLAYDRLGSTNDEAKRLAREGAPAWTTVWAREQSAGRGRRGRGFVCLPGNLFVTIILRPDRAPGDAAQLGFVAAIATGEAIAASVPAESELRHKWPNDLLLNGGKACGILLESETTASGALDWLVAGIGINVAASPSGVDFKTASVHEAGGAIDAEGMLRLFADRFHTWVERWQSEGFAPVRAAWLKRAIGIEMPVTVRLGDRTLEGRFLGLDDDGALLLGTAEATRRITAGDVFPAGG